MNASYVPGDHVVAVTGRAVVMTGPDHTAEVSRLVDGSPTPLGIISALSGGDLTRLPEFAAAVLDGTDLVVLVRGPYRVRTGDQDWPGDDVATWREHRVAAGDEVVIAHADESDDRRLPLTGGVVLAARVAWRPQASSENPAEVASPAAAQTSSPTAAQTSSPIAAEAVEPPSPAEAVDDAPAEQDPDVTVLEVEEADPESGEGTEAFDEAFDEIIGATIQGQRRPAPEPEPAPEPAPADGDHDGRTITAEQMRRLRAQKDSGAPTSTAPVSATLSLSGGETVDLTQPVLIGRSPRAAHKSGDQLPRMVVVDDPYVSGTHLEVGLRDGAVVATDHSTNGTMLARPGGTPERLPKDEPTVVADGCVLHLSDDLTVTVSVRGTAG